MVYDFEGSGERNLQNHIVILGFLEQHFQLVSESVLERYQKNKLQCLDMVFFGRND